MLGTELVFKAISKRAGENIDGERGVVYVSNPGESAHVEQDSSENGHGGAQNSGAATCGSDRQTPLVANG
jgi:hypothetical protein